MGVFVDGGWFRTAGDVWAEVVEMTGDQQCPLDNRQPLDARCNWHVVQITLYRQGHDFNAEVVDSLSSVWVSDDVESFDALRSTIRHQLLDSSDDTLPTIDNLEIVFK